MDSEQLIYEIKNAIQFLNHVYFQTFHSHIILTEGIEHQSSKTKYGSILVTDIKLSSFEFYLFAYDYMKKEILFDVSGIGFEEFKNILQSLVNQIQHWRSLQLLYQLMIERK